MAKNRRLSRASPQRYMLSRISLNLGKALHEASTRGVIDPAIVKLAYDVSYEEAQNWYVNYEPYHRAKAVVKDYMNELELPSRWQGLLMAYAEKIVANWYYDFKGESLSDIQQDYVRKLARYTPAGPIYVISYRRRNGAVRTVEIPVILRDIAIRVLTSLGASRSEVESALRGATPGAGPVSQ